MNKIEFFKHNIGNDEKKSMIQTLDSLFHTYGPKSKEFEIEFSKYLNAKFTVGVSSWTTGAFLTLKAWGIGKGDEVITTPLSFVATSNIIIHCGATPVFVDVIPETGNIDAEKIKKAITTKTKAIIPVHMYGHMADMKKINNIARKHKLKVLEDCAHCIEGSRNNIRPSNRSDAAVFSFYVTKNISCGEGGAISTNDKNLADKLKYLRLHGMSKSADQRYTKGFKQYEVEEPGYKANMFDLQASLLLPQLEKIDKYLIDREKITNTYLKGFKENQNIDFPKIINNTKSAYHLFTIWVDTKRRDDLLKYLNLNHIGCSVHFHPIHLFNYYRKKYKYSMGDFPNAEEIGFKTITLPLYPKLLEKEVKHIIKTVNKYIKK